MQLGFVGLGKMGGNMVHRIQRDSDHEVVAFDFNADAVDGGRGHGRDRRVARSRTSSRKLETPRTVWIMVPAGDPTEQTVDKLGELLDEGDTIVDGGNSQLARRQARARASSTRKGIHYVDVGTSGGVWGLRSATA